MNLDITASVGLRISRVGIAALLASFVVCTLVFAVPADAAFPGGNGKIAYHSDRDGNFEIYTIENDGSTDDTNPARLTNHASDDVTPAWSGDGTKIAFTSSRAGNYEIYTMNADGTGLTRVTTNAAADVQPTWSPDSTKIAFASDRDGNGEIYTMNANGTGPVRITNNAAADGWPAWSPDGTKIAFQTGRDGNNEIYSMNANGSALTRLTNHAGFDELPTWFPDGTKIAFDSNRAGDLKIFFMNSDGTNVVQKTVDAGLDFAVAVAPAGVHFIWQSNRDGNYDLFLLPGFTFLTRDAGADEYPDWQPVVRNYPRPKAATPINVSLVPAFKECTSPSTTHRGALSSPSCYAPTPESNYLTVGTPELNGAVTNSSGSVRMKAFCNGVTDAPPCLATAGDQLDGQISVSITDVRCQRTGGGCPGGPLTDYSDDLWFDTTFRITDKNNGPTGTGLTANATVADLPLRFSVPCTTTPSTSVGSTCSTNTSIDAVVGGTTAVTEQKRAIWQLNGDVKLYDGGTDGVASTMGDNTLFVVGGLFFP